MSAVTATLWGTLNVGSGGGYPSAWRRAGQVGAEALGELFGLVRLSDEVIAASVQAFAALIDVARRGQEQNRHGLARRQRADAPAELEAVHVGHGKGRAGVPARRVNQLCDHSHSIVAGGFDETS